MGTVGARPWTGLNVWFLDLKNTNFGSMQKDRKERWCCFCRQAVVLWRKAATAFCIELMSPMRGNGWGLYAVGEFQHKIPIEERNVAHADVCLGSIERNLSVAACQRLAVGCPSSLPCFAPRLFCRCYFILSTFPCRQLPAEGCGCALSSLIPPVGFWKVTRSFSEVHYDAEWGSAQVSLHVIYSLSLG